MARSTRCHIARWKIPARWFPLLQYLAKQVSMALKRESRISGWRRLGGMLSRSIGKYQRCSLVRTARLLYLNDQQLHSKACVVYCLLAVEVIRWKPATETRSTAGSVIRINLYVQVKSAPHGFSRKTALDKFTCFSSGRHKKPTMSRALQHMLASICPVAFCTLKSESHN